MCEKNYMYNKNELVLLEIMMNFTIIMEQK
jgi:hypothetical protein